IAKHGPLHTYELKDLQTQLVDVITIPLVGRDRDGWLRHAFRQFLVAFPYQQRHVYLAPGEQLPESTPDQASSKVDVKEFTRERLVFETDRPGQPHLIRMTYHPRWVSKGGEAIYLTEPSFMLIYPRTSTVELVYGWSNGGRIGAVFSLLGLLMLVAGLLWRPLRRPIVNMPEPSIQRGWFLGVFAAASIAILAFWWTDPEYAYQRGHSYGGQGDWTDASAFFDRAFAGRRTPARKSEALFWAARSLDLGGKKPEAAKRYMQLRANYPESYWYPESVFRLVEINLLHNDPETAESLYTELVETVPDNPWTQKAGILLGVTETTP
ncbi:MAG: tetratricopeptide repeat protein, partial [Xanthomonadales bacterium]|nr:tetratricopeptide repeat protein [Xanthomonadales bacterium]